ncbi:MAG: hypothetical protein M0T79_05180 [Actinomycetota bacterium]|nr:hypothetical protein [Actinomycetota bacterium]
MKLTHLLGKRLLPVTASAAAVALAAGGIAYASTSPSVTAAVTTASQRPTSMPAHTRPTRCWMRHPGCRDGVLRGEIGGLAGRAISAQFLVKTKTGYETIDVARGTLSSVSSTSAVPSTITVSLAGGLPSVSATITTSTRFPGLRQSALVTGDRVVLVQVVPNGSATGTTGSAMFVMARGPVKSPVAGSLS